MEKIESLFDEKWCREQDAKLLQDARDIINNITVVNKTILKEENNSDYENTIKELEAIISTKNLEIKRLQHREFECSQANFNLLKQINDYQIRLNNTIDSNRVTVPI